MRLYPDDVELSFLEAVLLSELGDLPAAEALFVRLLEDWPADPPAIAAHPGMRGHMARHNLAQSLPGPGTRRRGRGPVAAGAWPSGPTTCDRFLSFGLLVPGTRPDD